MRVRYGIALRADHDPWFWTLTLPGWVQSSAVGLRILPGRWDNFRKALQRQNPNFVYAAFVELHPHRANIPHFHVITFDPAPRRFKDLAVHCGFGHQAWEVEINGSKAISYVSKYASKQGAAMPRNFRRVRISHCWPSLPSPEYALKVYPIEKREALSAYLRRMVLTTGHPMEVLRDRWLARQ
jgi:hypothetical protein